jgi:hypothetical protein
MLKTLLACAVAALCAAIIVGLIPKPSAAAASALTDSNGGALNAVAGKAATSPAISRYGDCSQPWPYYERACLHDGRQTDGKSRFVRVITLDRTAANAVAR